MAGQKKIHQHGPRVVQMPSCAMNTGARMQSADEPSVHERKFSETNGCDWCRCSAGPLCNSLCFFAAGDGSGGGGGSGGRN